MVRDGSPDDSQPPGDSHQLTVSRQVTVDRRSKASKAMVTMRFYHGTIDSELLCFEGLLGILEHLGAIRAFLGILENFFAGKKIVVHFFWKHLHCIACSSFITSYFHDGRQVRYYGLVV